MLRSTVGSAVALMSFMGWHESPGRLGTKNWPVLRIWFLTMHAALGARAGDIVRSMSYMGNSTYSLVCKRREVTVIISTRLIPYF